MKSRTFWQFKILTLVSNHTVWRWASTNPSLKSNIRLTRKKLFMPAPTQERIKNLENITAVTVAYNCVSWAKISIPTLTVQNWSTWPFLDQEKAFDESLVLQVAHEIIPNLPTSDLYVVESQPNRWIRNINHFCLKCMLTALLRSKDDENVIFQSPTVMDKLHDLLVNGERKSPHDVLEEKLKLFSGRNETLNQGNDDSDWYSEVKVNPEHLDAFASYSEAEKGGVSLALLIALSFLDVHIFQNSDFN